MKRWVLFVSTRSILFLILIGTAFVLSLFFVKNLNVEAFPDPCPPLVEIIAIYEGRSAEEVERQVTVNLEVVLAGMDGMERINSISLYGLSDIKCKFSYGVNYKEAKQEVINRLSNVALPGGVQPQIVPNPVGEIMRYSLKGSENLLDLRTLQDWTVARYLKTAEGVEDVVSEGGYVKTYDVIAQPESLLKYGVTLGQLIDALSKANLNVGGRVIEKGDQYYMVRGLGLIRNLEDIEKTVVALKNGKPILVKHVAKVSIGNLPKTGISALNERDEIVMGTVVLRKDAKSIPCILSVNQKIKELNERILPKGIKLEPYMERWDLIVTVVKKVIETAASGIGLVSIALFFFLGNFRAAIITALVIPISLLITLAVMAFKGESANLLSIGAIDFGIIADIPLILIEDYFRQTKKGRGGFRAISMAAEEVGKPMLFSVVIILLAFTPIFMMKGAEGQVFSPMAKTYLYAIFFTLVMTFSYLVAAQSWLLSTAEDKEFKPITLVRSAYSWLIKQTIPFAFPILLIVGILVGGILYSCLKVVSTEFLPKMDEGNMYIRMVFPYTISLAKTYENAVKAKNLLRNLPEVRAVDFKMGRPEDGTDPNGPFNSEYFVLLHPYDQWKTGLVKAKIEEMARDQLTRVFPNADISISQYNQDNLEEMMSGVKGENTIKIFGDDLIILDELAQKIKEALHRIPGIEGEGILRELGQPNLLIDVNRDNAAALGLSVQEVLETVSASLGGREITKVIEGDKSFSLIVSFPAEYRKEPARIGEIPISLPNGGVVELSRLADIRYDTGASFIYREGFRRYIPIKFEVQSSDLGGTVKLAQNEVEKIPCPEGYYLVWSGIFNEMKESFGRLVISIPIAIFLILTVLYILYSSVRNVLIVMAAPVFAITAGLVSLILAGESLSVSSIVGFISIIGVSILNSSIIVSHFIRLTMNGMNRKNAILETARDKFRPVLMGGFVASLGLLPASMAQGVGSQVQKPLAIVVVGGMLIGTAMILLFIPLLLNFVQGEHEFVNSAGSDGNSKSLPGKEK
ncbi:MAG: efflux RND transporter permease subunit [Candidatus Riflebacteria bacterium]|nr:efflux RND transporter permease subunit [Candidatus Riflebacteria bacterium]